MFYIYNYINIELHTYIITYIHNCIYNNLKVKVLVAWSCLTLSLPGSSDHGILQARIWEWVAIPSSRGSFWSRDRTDVSCSPALAGRFFTTESPGKPNYTFKRTQFAHISCKHLSWIPRINPVRFPTVWLMLIASPSCLCIHDALLAHVIYWQLGSRSRALTKFRFEFWEFYFVDNID